MKGWSLIFHDFTSGRVQVVLESEIDTLSNLKWKRRKDHPHMSTNTVDKITNLLNT